ncbi:hypothetical protein OIU78_010888 [Salix suchowensis]|nr:hypothetical protein OIU78_010888 [Salix suchowensis]
MWLVFCLGPLGEAGVWVRAVVFRPPFLGPILRPQVLVFVAGLSSGALLLGWGCSGCLLGLLGLSSSSRRLVLGLAPDLGLDCGLHVWASRVPGFWGWSPSSGPGGLSFQFLLVSSLRALEGCLAVRDVRLEAGLRVSSWMELGLPFDAGFGFSFVLSAVKASAFFFDLSLGLC